jgi:hypothetical protein
LLNDQASEQEKKYAHVSVITFNEDTKKLKVLCLLTRGFSSDIS